MHKSSAMDKSDIVTRNSPLASQAYETLRASIIACEISPGEKLKIDALQKVHKFSSSPLREALNRLVAEGLVTSDDRRGFRTAPMTSADLNDLTRCRTIQEAAAFELAIQHGDDAWEASVVAAFHQLEKVERQINRGEAQRDDRWTHLHKTFHIALISACQSERLISACENHFDQSERYRRLSASVRSKSRNTVAEHKALVDCALRRDAAKARTLIVDHIEKTAANVARYLKEKGL
ncbi:FCD domain-containing protein [Methylocella sp. CPCC 101449]|uniref:GntR family transcriptional regulator n=1 Tax=Methylocella sp. CPCC 101449 TaxID=2987531 RepID=UPI00288FE8D1|nr:FCD domain-containing protein [Methylocella sp. CPCC 101449]MDT2022627.1 FCD domain-containing protein [Methylocella sp. CPCC 101449]